MCVHERERLIADRRFLTFFFQTWEEIAPPALKIRELTTRLRTKVVRILFSLFNIPEADTATIAAKASIDLTDTFPPPKKMISLIPSARPKLISQIPVPKQISVKNCLAC